MGITSQKSKILHWIADVDVVSASAFWSLQYHKEEILSWYYYFLLHLILKAGGGQGSL